MTKIKTRMLWLTAVVWLLGCAGLTALADVQVLGAHFRADKAFPQYHQLWHEDSNDPDAPEGGVGLEVTAKEPLGASVHVLLRNTGSATVKIVDLEYAGESLKQSLVYSDQRRVRKFASISFSKLPAERLEKLIAAGEPIWWKIDPLELKPGSTGQVVVRLRRIPEAKNVELAIKHVSGKKTVVVPVQTEQPRLEGVFFSPNRQEVYLYFQHSEKGKSPVKVILDGQDVTANVTMARDSGLQIVPGILKLNRPLARGSFHVFHGVYDDGQTASAGLRAWSDEYGYGIWGGPPGKASDEEIARKHILDLAAHNINLQVANIASPPVQTFLKSPVGHQFAAANGLRFIPDEVQKWGVRNPYQMFIHDEPDCADYKMEGVAEGKKIGGLAQWCIQHSDEIRAGEPDELNMLNIDNTYKPQNWYIYGQVADVMSLDPYYQPRLHKAFWEHPERIPLYSKATYVYAAAEVAESACQPNPMHVILYACNMTNFKKNRVFPFPSPECKRIEAFYALAAGAKGLSYWWYTPRMGSDKGKKDREQASSGVGAGPILGDPDAMALWREIGLLGAEIRTLGPVLMESCPADVELQMTKGLLGRTLLSGLDTIVLLVVTDQYANSEKGIQYSPIEKAEVTMKLPSWLKSPQVFEVTAQGTNKVKAQANGERLSVNLGQVDVTRAIVVTSDGQLRGQLQKLYDSQFKVKVARLGEQKETRRQ